jgi:NAD(P)-dependent dehydrogenase (short-subunit alcohol dehydrogenase family)
MLTNKIIVVTGGAGLLGNCFCNVIADNNATVIIADLNIERAEQIAKEIRSRGKRADAISLDITDKTSIEKMIANVHKTYQKVDAVVNNAYPKNLKYGQNIEDVTYTDFCENSNMHLGGYFLVAQQLALYFRENGGGNILNMSSIYGSLAPRFGLYKDTTMTMPVEYAAIKSAINHLTRYFAQYFKSDGIRCNTLSPGGIFDNQPAVFLESYNSRCGLKGMLDMEDISGPLIFLLSDASKYVTGQNLIVDDGFSL